MAQTVAQRAQNMQEFHVYREALFSDRPLDDPASRINPVSPSQRGTLTSATQVWGVVVDESTGLVYVSDMNAGLWILRRTD